MPNYPITKSKTYNKRDVTNFDIIEGPLSEELDLSGSSNSDKVFLLFLGSDLFDGCFFNGFLNVSHGGCLFRCNYSRASMVASQVCSSCLPHKSSWRKTVAAIQEPEGFLTALLLFQLLIPP